MSLQGLRQLNADGCIQFDQQGASLTPDWSDAARKRVANGLQPPTFTPGVISLQMTPGPNPPSAVGCTVNASFVRASMQPAFGVAGMEGLGGLASGAPHSGVLAPKKVFISAGVAVGMIAKKVVPVYPPVALAARVQGTVVLQATISKTGEITDLKVVSGPALLQSAAIDAVQQWQYKPYLLNGEPVEVETTINVIFSLGIQPPATPNTPQVPAEGP
jgi:protein TonB